MTNAMSDIYRALHGEESLCLRSPWWRGQWRVAPGWLPFLTERLLWKMPNLPGIVFFFLFYTVSTVEYSKNAENSPVFFFKINHCTNADHSISWIKPSIAKPRNHMGETANAVFFKMYPAPSLTSCSPILSCPLENRTPRWLGWSPSPGWTKIISS